MKPILRISSLIFEDQEGIPSKHTCDGDNINPELHVEGIPAGAKSLILILEDPDASAGTWVHWLVWNIPPTIKAIKENSVPRNSVQGLNSWNRIGYGGPCPPSGTHRYIFKLYALDCLLNIDPNSNKSAVVKAMQNHILASAQLTGLYRR